ncbi:YqaA family protein [Gabonibacter massiliensis]|uniref:YqaA family protein n=1 Tax=Gabonibacter massiliensis TaxID=1720195 RepID=UPI0033076487
MKREQLERQKEKIDRYGVWLALFTWLPLVGDLFAIALGFYRVSPKMSALYMLVGRFVRFLVWTLLYIRYADRFVEWIR